MDTIKLQPTWVGTAPLLLALIENGSDTGRKYAIEEVKRMAQVADMHVEQQEEEEPAPEPEVDLASYCGTIGGAPIIGYNGDGYTSRAIRKYQDQVTHNTVLGHLALHHPELLRYMDDDADATQRDGWWLGHRAREQELTVITVTAPPVLVDQGITTVRAWPVELLNKRFPDT